VKWTRRTTEKIAAELGTAGIVVCPNTGRQALEGPRLPAPGQRQETQPAKGPGRDAQFVYIAAMRESFAQAGLPVVSVDSKHRELVRGLQEPRCHLGRRAHLGERPRLPLQAKGVPCPTGSTTSLPTRLCLGRTTHDTDLQSTTWQVVGLPRAPHYPGAPNCSCSPTPVQQPGHAPGPGSYGLQHACATGTGLTSPFATTGRRLEVNPIDTGHFGEISKNWAGRPLADYETVVNYISTTDQVRAPGRAHLVRSTTPLHQGQRQEIKDLSVRHHDTQPNRNNTSAPGDWLPKVGSCSCVGP